MGKTKHLNAFEWGMVVLCRFVSRNCNAAEFFTQKFCVCIKNGPPPKGHPANLTQLWEALESIWVIIPVERFRHLVESMPRRIVAVLRAKRGMQLNIRKVFLMFGILSEFLRSNSIERQ
jgi:hypothetical protein